jgi:hypothetical protein
MVQLYYHIKYRGSMAPVAATGHHGVMKRSAVWLTNEQVQALAAISKKSLAPLSVFAAEVPYTITHEKMLHKCESEILSS